MESQSKREHVNLPHAGDATISSWRTQTPSEGTAHVLFGRHANECAMLAYGCAVVLGLALPQCGAIAQAAWLHDVGELMLPRDFGINPETVNPNQRNVSDAHCRLGASLIHEERNALGANAEMYADVAIYHHERWDGTGYPFALSGERIPFAARLVSVVDFFQDFTRWSDDDSLVSEARAIHALRDGRGSRFDPRCADALINCLGHDLLGKIRQFGALFSGGLGSLQPLENIVSRALVQHRKAAQRARQSTGPGAARSGSPREVWTGQAGRSPGGAGS